MGFPHWESSSWWHVSYFADWAITATFTFAIWGSMKFVSPFCRKLHVTDESISYPYAEHETFPAWTLPIITWLVPICVVVGTLFIHNRMRVTALGHIVHHSLLVITQAVCLAIAITEPIKVYAGRYRPDFLDRLRREGVNTTYFMESNCDTDSAMIKGGMKSFLSGHTSMSFAGWMAVSLILSTRVPLFSRFLLQAGSITFAAIVGVSRTRDYRHHFADVTAGAMLGIITAYVSFTMHFTRKAPFNRKLALTEVDDRTEMHSPSV
eukprot:Sspe_Gene.100161::Locus_74883_Transcript_1_6_Confidence_0.375_Length_892::g.100161::m.100161/K18693/DPP1, DPPL, PLPP4_5; diacylglycerol diphosphate phosphatase / phosphatidate phosphatase